jgi:hypothetical protein
MKETNWKSICKTILLNEVRNTIDHTEFMTKINHDYKMNSSQLRELGFDCILELKRGEACEVFLYTDRNEAIAYLEDAYRRWCHLQLNVHKRGLTHVYIDEATRLFREAETD